MHSLQSTRVWKWPVVKDKHMKMKPKICVLFAFDFVGECRFIKNKTLYLLKKYSLRKFFFKKRVQNVVKGDRNKEKRKNIFLHLCS